MNIKVVTKNKEQKDEITKRIFEKVQHTINEIKMDSFINEENNELGFNFSDCEIHVVDIWAKINVQTNIYKNIATTKEDN